MSTLLIFLLASTSARAAGTSWYDEVGTIRGVAKVRLSDSESARDAVVPATSACQISVLEKLGWKVTRATGTTQIFYTPGEACNRSTLDEVHAEGGLTIQIPEGMEEAKIQAALAPVLTSAPSVCGYKFLVRSAIQTAVDALNENHGFSFHKGGWPYVQFFRPEYWQTSCAESGRPSCFFPRVENHVAIGEFTQGKIATDCALGLQAAEYETLRVLFGDAEFDAGFRAKEIVFAPWKTLYHTESATWGRLTNRDSLVDPFAKELSKLGALAFTGLSGYIGNVYGEAYLDTPIDRGENFATISVSLAAASELKKRGGFEYFNRQNVRIFHLGRFLEPELEAKALTTVDPATLPLPEAERAVFRELQSILASPVYRDYLVYVHPQGNMTLGEHLVRLLKVNPRTPYSIQLYPSRMHRGIFLRYVNAQLASCGR
jgi:hypothetical protein